MRDNEVADQFQDQLKHILDEYATLKTKAEYSDLSDLGLSVAHRLISLSRAAIERISGTGSSYSKQFQIALNKAQTHDYERLTMVIGVVEALYDDLRAGYITTITEMLHGEIFADFLEMANYLLTEGYKDAAAVIGGGTLESHLRQLCIKNSIDVEFEKQNGIRAKKADQMNSDLAGENIYSKLYQKSITAWLDLRNKAAHGQYSEYTKEQVAIMITGIRDFILRNPA